MTNQHNALAFELNGIQFENPFLLASAPPTSNGDKIRAAFRLGWGGAVIKTIRPESVHNSNVTPRFDVVRSQSGEIIGFENIEMLSEKSVDYWCQEITDIKREFPTKILIASLMGDATCESWQAVTRQVAAAGADAVELNFSCPNGVTAQGLGLAIGQDPAHISEITQWVKSVSAVPVLVKLTPNVTDIAAMAEAAVKGGADAIAAINTVSSLIGVDIENLNPLPAVANQSTYGGYSGLAVKPIGLRCVSQIRARVDVPVYGMGGIGDWQSAVEYIAVGAGAVQICTAVMLHGMGIIKPMMAGLTDYMSRKGFDSLTQLCGVATQKITSHGALSRTYRVVSQVDRERCVRCFKCEKICRESGYLAIAKEAAGITINPEKCDGCALCTFVCASRALQLTERVLVQ